MPLQIIRDDIVNMRTDAVINPSNKYLKIGGGTSYNIFKTAGKDKLQQACDKLAPIEIGNAIITPAFDFPVKYIIHTAGPKYDSDNIKKSEELLKQTYKKALVLALANGCKSIAFPLLSSGSYHFPKEAALRIARTAIQEFLEDNEMDVFLLVFDKDSFKVGIELLGQVKSYIDENYVDEHTYKRNRMRKKHKQSKFLYESSDLDLNDSIKRINTADISKKILTADLKTPIQAQKQAYNKDSINEAFLNHIEDSFSTTLMKLIDKKGKTDVEVYKKANIDRKLFSKIRSKKDYTPTKATILALAISLELSLSETEDLLKRAGYAFSHANKFDLIIEFFIGKNKYNIFEINEVLFSFDQPLLGSKNN